MHKSRKATDGVFLAAFRSEQMPKSAAGLRIKRGFNWFVWPLLMKLCLAGALAVARSRARGDGCGVIHREAALVPARRGGKRGQRMPHGGSSFTHLKGGYDG